MGVDVARVGLVGQRPQVRRHLVRWTPTVECERAPTANQPTAWTRLVRPRDGQYLLLGTPVPAYVTAAAQLFRYHEPVFIGPPWPQIDTTDNERHQDFAEAVRTPDAMVAAYTQHGYELGRHPAPQRRRLPRPVHLATR
ncbi:AAA family ATPase [Micromonospora sp. NPDC005174]|uniref:AAA family ATPase n=1 Tax=Micromonospora sp. NPDC005174 TaxID=3157018 RepID=UPI0033B64BB9